jgi:hypothetical protein
MGKGIYQKKCLAFRSHSTKEISFQSIKDWWSVTAHNSLGVLAAQSPIVRW